MEKATTLLKQQIDNIVAAIDGICGISALHIETGLHFSHNEHEHFPMASTYKVPIAIQCLTLVDQGMLDLTTLITPKLTEIRPEAGILNKRFHIPGIALSIHNLIRLMIEVSDNTATDLILNLSGGPQAVTARLKAAKIENMRIDRSCLRLIAEHEGIETLPIDEEITLDKFLNLENSLTTETRNQALKNFFKDPQDTCTPTAMTELLKQLQTKRLLYSNSTTFLLQCMYHCQTGLARSLALLPPNIRVAQKTGTITGAINDVGIICLPNDAGHLAYAIFIKAATAPTNKQEQIIAQIARTLFDYMIFQT